MPSFRGSLLLLGLALVACSSGKDRPPNIYGGEIPPPGSGPDASVPPPGGEGTYAHASCPFVPPSGVTVECGYLTVAEDRRASSNERGVLQLAVGVFKAAHPDAAAAPLVYLDGGPGGPALDDVVSLWSVFAPLANHYDLVVLDQRGTGHSIPSLSCDPPATTGDGGPTATVQACRDKLAAKVVSLSNFDSASSASDVDDLRIALGYPVWNLFGVSYGTRLALTVVRDHPASIRSVVIDSVLPPQVDALADAGKNANRAFEHIFDSCASQPACLGAFPTLRQDFYDTLAALAANPAMIALTDGRIVKFDADDVIELLLTFCYAAAAIPYLPQIIEELHQEQYAGLTEFLSAAPSPQKGGGFAVGMNLSVICREMAPFSSRDAFAQANADLPPVIGPHFAATDLLDMCDLWNVAPAAPIEHLAVASDLPSLVLSGGYDPVTPPAWGQLAASTLSRSTFVELADQSHGAFEDVCARSTIDRFVADPAAALDTSCADSRPPIAFRAPPPVPTTALVRKGSASEPLPDSVRASILQRMRQFHLRWPR